MTFQSSTSKSGICETSRIISIVCCFDMFTANTAWIKHEFSCLQTKKCAKGPGVVHSSVRIVFDKMWAGHSISLVIRQPLKEKHQTRSEVRQVT